MNRTVVVGVDGGSTKTDCVAVDLASKQVIGRFMTAASNWNSVGGPEALQTLQSAIIGALAVAGKTTEDVAAVCLGVSGVDTPKDVHALTQTLRAFFPAETDIMVDNDSVIALACGTDGRLEGCVLVAGTGTIAFVVREDGTRVRASGWGPAFLDGGSGYDVGQRALAAIARAVDGRGPQTDLVELICNFCGVPLSEDLIGWAYAEPGWSRIASLAPVVVQCATEGDTVAQGVLQAAIAELVAAVVSLEGRCKFDGPFDLVLSGGLLTEGFAYSDMCEAALRKQLPHANIIHPKVEAAIGAALLACRKAEARRKAAAAALDSATRAGKALAA
ncbi:hypothetical protein WJX72_002863 [[Myrmecia] bisecta]|uniref:N-acetyl-D-glucosamine kinase n=1 Tax=[Myrmecia] bisecta TaxID=41462 RepID=A0AAW1QPJ8_9CHLO